MARFNRESQTGTLAPKLYNPYQINVWGYFSHSFPCSNKKFFLNLLQFPETAATILNRGTQRVGVRVVNGDGL
jgi:hypothetical protein